MHGTPRRGRAPRATACAMPKQRAIRRQQIQLPKIEAQAQAKDYRSANKQPATASELW